MGSTALEGRPYVENPHEWFDEGNGVSAKPRCLPLLSKRVALKVWMSLAGLVLGSFAASAEISLPSSYTTLEYVRSTGSQYIDTRCAHDATYKVELDMQFLAAPGNGGWVSAFGARTSSSTTDSFGLWIHNVNNKLVFWKEFGGARGDTSIAAALNTDYHVHLEKNGTSTVNGATLGTGAAAASSRNDFLFAMNNGGSAAWHSAARISSCKISAGSTLIRDFIPCRNDQGEAGFWDRVEGRFYGSATSTKLFGNDDEAEGVSLNFLESVGATCVDTEVAHTGDTVVDLKVRFLGAPGNGGWVSAFGARSGSRNNDAFGLWIHNSSGTLKFWKEFGGSGNGDTSVGATVGVDYVVHLVKSGTCSVNGTTLGTGVSGTSPRNDYLFCLNDNGGAGWHSASRLYYCRFSSASTGEVTADLKPHRKQDGTVCFADSVRNKYLTPKSGALRYGYAYSLVGTALGVRDGKLSDELFGDYPEVRKIYSRSIDASGVLSYPAALTLQAGRFALTNGQAQAVSVTGALTLHGGMRLDLDVGETACDRFTAGSLVLDESATEANPIVVCVTGLGINALSDGASLPFISVDGQTLTETDAQRFRVDGMTVRVVARNGVLVLEPIPAVLDAYWTGSASRDEWSCVDNWRNREMPMRGATVTFGETAGGRSLDDLGLFALDKVIFNSASGAYTLAGSDVLTVATGLLNASAAAQTLTVPMTLGVAGSSFPIETVGDLNLTDGVKTPVASEIIKGGTGTLTLNDEVLAAAKKITVTNGTLKVNSTGRVTTAATAGELRIQKGARLDLNMSYGNALTFAKSEPVHGKVVYVEGSGPDGKGVVINSNTSATWGSAFGRVVLTDDATMGGAGHFSFRTLDNSREPNARVEGGHTLTITNTSTYVSTSDYVWIPNSYATTFALDRFDLHGVIQFEMAQAGAITNGLHCYGSSMLRFCNTVSFTPEMPVTIETGTTILEPNGTGARTFNGAFTVKADTVVTNNNVQATFNGATTLEGSFIQVGTTVTTFSGRLAGNGKLAGGAVRFSGANTSWTMAANDEGFTSKVDVNQVTDVAFLTGLKRIEVSYTGDPQASHTFDVAPSGTLTQKQVSNDLTLVVKDATDTPVPNCWLEVTTEGRLVLHIADTTLIRTATWQGGATGALDESANWICSNDVAVVADQLPQAMTVLVVPDGGVFNCPIGSTLDYARIEGPAHLGGDCDWRGLPDPTINSTIDLNGYKLYLSDLKGTGALIGTEYEEVEYIESHATEWIDTGYSHDGTTIVDMKIQFTGLPNNSWACYYGSRAGYDNTQFGGWINNNGHPSVTYHYKGVKQAEGDVTALGAVKTGVDYVVHLEKNGSCTINGGALDTGTGGTANRNDLLFAMRDGPNNNAVRFPSQNRLYFCQIRSGSTLVRDFVPARRLANGEYGLIDRANGNSWYGNSGGGAFTGGAPLVTTTYPMGEVHLDVPEGKTITNTSLTLRGNVKLVKEGAGTFVANKPHQYYGATWVKAGTATLPVSGETGTGYSFKYYPYGAPGTSITVEKGAVFDTKGNYDFYNYPVVLNGGTLANTGCNQTNYGSWGCNGKTLLTDDSFFQIDYYTAHSSDFIDLGGKTLNASIASGKYLFMNTFMKNGTLKTSGEGTVQFRTTTAKDMRTVDIVLGTAISVWDVDVSVRNLTTIDYAGALGNGGNGVKIFGVYKPVNDYVHNFTLQDKSTFDLSTRTEPFDLTDKSLAFASDALIYVEMGARPIGSCEPVIVWTEASQPANLATLSFKAPPRSRYAVVKRDDGVYVMGGLTIFVR